MEKNVTCKDVTTLSDDELKELETEYDLYKVECRCALRLALALIENLREQMEYNSVGKIDIFCRIEDRVKTFESTIEKCFRKKYYPNMDNIRGKIRDIAGIRIITLSLANIKKIADRLALIPGLNIVDWKDYVCDPKANGYSSFHLCCQVEIYNPYCGSKLVPVEIQIRTISMDAWAKAHSFFNYKGDEIPPELAKEFREVAESARQMDGDIERILNRKENASANESAVASKIRDIKSVSPDFKELKPKATATFLA